MRHRCRSFLLAGLLLAVLLAAGLVASAQDAPGGAFCARAFDDVNGDQQRDPLEPMLAVGFAVHLQNADGVVIASQAVEESPDRGAGLVCFRGLAAGQYGLFVTSAIYRPTTPSQMVASITPGELPVVLSYGAQRIDLGINPADYAAAQTDDGGMERLVAASLGAAAAMLVTLLIGALMFFFVMRAPASARAAPPAAPRRRPPGFPPPQRPPGSDPYGPYQDN